MSDWSLNIGVGIFGRAFGGASLSEGADPLASGGVELSPGFLGAAVIGSGRGEHDLDVYASIEVAPIFFMGARRRHDDSGVMLTGGAGLQLRAPIPIDTGSAIIHPVAPYINVGFTTHDDAPGAAGVDFRMSAGVDFALYENANASVGLNLNYSLISDDEHTFSAGISGSFDLFGGLRTSSF